VKKKSKIKARKNGYLPCGPYSKFRTDGSTLARKKIWKLGLVGPGEKGSGENHSCNIMGEKDVSVPERVNFQ